MKSLQKYRSTFFLIAIAITLAVINLAFSYIQNSEEIIMVGSIENTEKEMEIIRTPPERKKKELPPPDPEIIEPNDTEILEDVDFVDAEDLQPEPIEFDSTYMIIDSSIFEPIISKGTEISKDEAPSVAPPEENNEVFAGYQVEKMPFMGDCHGLDKAEMEICFLNAFRKYMSKNIHYPSIAKENRIEGNVVVQFVVRKTGELEEIKVVRDIGGGCGAEAKRVIEGMPKWSPGIQRGRPVNVRFTAPIKFQLE